MSKYADMQVKYKRLSKKAVAGIATYNAVKKTAKKFADNHAATWQIDQDYNWDLWAAASEATKEHRVNMPFAPERKVEMPEDEEDNPRVSISQWVPLNVPGCTRLLQVKTPSYGVIEFRAPRMRDFEPLRRNIESRMTVKAETVPRINFDDFPSTTQIMSWNSEKQQWEFRKERATRSFSSVFLPAELQAEIENDLKTFTASRKRLNRLELSWRRGYLLSGPPGTGKTSLSLAVAGSLSFQLASLSLTDIKSDGELRKAVGQLRNRTVLVIEDIDAYSVSNDREHNAAKDGDLSLSGLLNALDGFETPEGLVTIATTNHAENLDPALVRSGRLDRIFTLDWIASTELERLYTWFYEQRPASAAPPETHWARLAPAEATEIFKQHLDDPEGGWTAVLARIEEAVSAGMLAAA